MPIKSSIQLHGLEYRLDSIALFRCSLPCGSKLVKHFCVVNAVGLRFKYGKHYWAVFPVQLLLDTQRYREHTLLTTSQSRKLKWKWASGPRMNVPNTHALPSLGTSNLPPGCSVTSCAITSPRPNSTAGENTAQ